MIVFVGCCFLAGCLGPRARPGISPRPRRGEALPSARFLPPLKTAEVLSPFGWRHGHLHTGIDLRETQGGGDIVYASRAGRVVEVGTRRGYGRTVLLQHEDGYCTRYAHLRALTVRRGDRVKALQGIGIVGDTGDATTAHLHFEILTPRRRPIDPAPNLFKRQISGGDRQDAGRRVSSREH